MGQDREGEVKGIDKGTEGRILLKEICQPQIPAKKCIYSLQKS
jgi:hypothetical protein